MNAIAKYFNERTDDWENNFNKPSPVQGAVAAIAAIGPESKVLDLGCGTGVMAPVYLELGVKRALALDLAPRMIEIAQGKYVGQPSLEFKCCDAYDFKTDERFDAVVIYNAYPHFLDKQALAKKVASLLVDGGRFVVAHSLGRTQMNGHHSNVPVHVTTCLRSVQAEAGEFEEFFHIDTRVDSPGFYCFAGTLK